MKALIETLNNCKAILEDYYEYDLAEAVNEYDVENQIDNIHKIMFMILPKEYKFARQCSCCEEGMNEGYVIDGGGEYYCNEECLHTKHTADEIEEMELGADDSESYWTKWESDSDMEYILVNNILIFVGEQ
jgi:hypothetical protein